MKLYYWRGFDNVRNFGDELNPWIWDKILPNQFNDDNRSIFVGIGTLLNDRIPKADKTVIMGAGVGYGPPPTHDDSWFFYAVRGPITAQKMGISIDLAITDPAILVHRLFSQNHNVKECKYGLLPHWLNANPGWNDICEPIGFKYINPLDDVNHVLSEISKVETLVTEAMHGAIVADSIRIPWIPVHSQFSDYLPQKWNDWCATMELDYASNSILRLNDSHADLKENNSSFYQSGRRILRSAYSRIQKKRLQSQLRKIVNNIKPCLSRELVLRRQLHRMDEAIGKFKRDYANGLFD